MVAEEQIEELPNLSLQFHFGQSLTDGEMEKFIKRQRNPQTFKLE